MLSLDNLPPLLSGTVILQAGLGQDRMTTAWAQLVAPPSSVTARDTEQAAGEIGAYGIWQPVKTQRVQQGPEVWTQTTTWERPQAAQRLLSLVTEPGYLSGQVTRLTALGFRLNPYAFTGWEVDEDATNDLGRWNLLLAPVPGNWGRVILDTDFIASDVATALKDGRWLAEIIESELLSAETSAEVVQVLAGYQLVISQTGQLSFLGDRTGGRRDLVFSTWSEEEEARDAASLPIKCAYLRPGETNGEIVRPRGATGVPFLVREPANTIWEAELEIALQRAQLEQGRVRAAGSLGLDRSLAPLNWVRKEGETQEWQILSVSHKWPPGAGAEVSELRLRAG